MVHYNDSPEFKVSFNVDETLRRHITEWQDYLKNEKRFSGHTVAAYSRDLNVFLTFLFEYRAAVPTIKLLAGLKVTDFRAFLANRTAKSVSRPLTFSTFHFSGVLSMGANQRCQMRALVESGRSGRSRGGAVR